MARELRLGKPSHPSRAIETEASMTTPKPNGRRRAVAASYGWANQPPITEHREFDLDQRSDHFENHGDEWNSFTV